MLVSRIKYPSSPCISLLYICFLFSNLLVYYVYIIYCKYYFIINNKKKYTIVSM